MLRKRPTKILAISPGTREMGVAVLEGSSLIYFGVKTLRRGKLPDRVLRQGGRIVERLIDEYDPQVLALEKTFYAGSKRSSILHVFCKEIMAVAKEKGINFFEYPPTMVRKIVCGDGMATKKETARVIVNRFPELSEYLIEPKWYSERQRERYWMNMFDAVAVALACHQKDLDK
ncbi:MAG TPA: crossover junction endodeoxyribonuclease RuvC [Candidatus Brocadiia bacterium]|nr:crossover junction endodeoxyribonuclease RuvC [Candidatus Brocadiales bacterium]